MKIFAAGHHKTEPVSDPNLCLFPFAEIETKIETKQIEKSPI